MNNPQLIEQVLDAYQGDVTRAVRDLESAQRLRSATKKTQVPDTSDKPLVVDVQNVTKTYKLGKTKVTALDDVSVQIREGEMVALLGTSGSGKSTLLHMIGGLDVPTTGTVTVDGENLRKLRDGKLSRYRGQKIGFVFQSFYLQPFLNVQDNIEVPAMFARTKRADRRTRSEEIAQAVELDDRIKHFGKELSGGQIQRTAIARALINRPKLLLADEPTGNLDSATAGVIFDLFEKIRRDFGTTIIVVTHDERLAARMDRQIRLSDGKVTA